MNTGTESYNRLDNPTGGGDISGQSRTANQSSLAGNGDSSKVERKRKGLADDRYGIMGQCDQLGVKGSGPFSSSDNAAKQAVSGEFSEKDSGFTKRQCTGKRMQHYLQYEGNRKGDEWS